VIPRGFETAVSGYQTREMSPATSELRIPADAAYIVVAKRAAAGFAAVAGFGLEAIDDLTIAVAQACENAISLVQRAGATGQVRLAFKLEGQRLEIQVRSVCGRNEEPCAPDQQVAVAPAAAPRSAPETQPVAATDLALRMMGLFVDDFRYRVDERTGGLRVRLTKYRIS